MYKGGSWEAHDNVAIVSHYVAAIPQNDTGTRSGLRIRQLAVDIHMLETSSLLFSL